MSSRGAGEAVAASAAVAAVSSSASSIALSDTAQHTPQSPPSSSSPSSPPLSALSVAVAEARASEARTQQQQQQQQQTVTESAAHSPALPLSSVSLTTTTAASLTPLTGEPVPALSQEQHTHTQAHTQAHAQHTQSPLSVTTTTAAAAAERLYEYVCVCSIDETVFDESTSLLDGPPLLSRRFRARNVARYPLADRKRFECPERIADFAFPGGVSLHTQPQSATQHSFVLTAVDGTKYYGFCMTFCVRVSDSALGVIRQVLGVQCFEGDGEELELPTRVYAQRAFVLLSSVPDTSGFDELLPMLIGKFAPFDADTLELVGVMLDSQVNGIVPMPGVRVCIDLGAAERSASVRPALRAMEPMLLIEVLTAILNERSVVFAVTDLAVLTPVIEGTLALLMPFEWPFAYVPLLPRAMLGILEAPMPFIVGVETAVLEEVPIPEDVFVVRLDSNELEPGSVPVVELPTRKKLRLFDAIRKYGNLFAYHHPDVSMQQPQAGLYTPPSALPMVKATKTNRRYLTMRTLDALYDSDSTESEENDSEWELHSSPANAPRVYGEMHVDRDLYLRELDAKFGIVFDVLKRQRVVSTALSSLRTQLSLDVKESAQWRQFERCIEQDDRRHQIDKLPHLWEAVKSFIICQQAQKAEQAKRRVSIRAAAASAPVAPSAHWQVAASAPAGPSFSAAMLSSLSQESLGSGAGGGSGGELAGSFVPPRGVASPGALRGPASGPSAHGLSSGGSREVLVYNALFRGSRKISSTDDPPIRSSALRKCFRHVLISLVKLYRRHLHLQGDASLSTRDLFNADAFLAEMQDDCVEFMTMLIKTQLFTQFLHSRITSRGFDELDSYIQRLCERQAQRNEMYGMLTLSTTLLKQTSIMKQWKKRHHTLEGLHIYEVKDRERALKLQLVPEHTTVTVPTSMRDDHHAFPFLIKAGSKQLLVCAMSSHERREWIRTIIAKTARPVTAFTPANDSLRTAVQSEQEHMRREVARIAAQFAREKSDDLLLMTSGGGGGQSVSAAAAGSSSRVPSVEASGTLRASRSPASSTVEPVASVVGGHASLPPLSPLLNTAASPRGAHDASAAHAPAE